MIVLTKYKYFFLFLLVMILFTACVDKDLHWQQGDGYRYAELPVTVGDEVGFSKLDSATTGIKFINGVTDEQIISNQHLLDGSGVALGDLDNDGYCDIYLCRLNGPNALYRNLGNWEFENITNKAQVGLDSLYSKGALFADIDGDLDLDLLVTVLDGPNACFINDGTGVFRESADERGLSSLPDRTGNTSMAIGDVDGDGDLDLYMVCYKFKARRDRESPVFSSSGLIRFEPDYAERDLLYINNGRGYFTDIALDSNTFLSEEGKPFMMPQAWGLTAQIRDTDDDGDPDIYVCNDFASSDLFWINNGSGQFQLIPRLSVRTTSRSSMTVDFSDIDRDGDMDFFVADMLSRDHQKRKMQMGEMPRAKISVGLINNRPQIMRNTFNLNRGDNTYAEIAHYTGLYASDWTWSAIFMDVDLDGYEDLLMTTGHAYDVQDYDTQNKIIKEKYRSIDQVRRTIFMYPRLNTTNYLFRNKGDLTFEEIGEKWGFNTLGISHGMALGDLDNDGDLDVVVNNFESEAGIYKNETEASRIAVRLKGNPPNTQAIGAKIKLSGGTISQSKEIIGGGQYLSGSDPLVVFSAKNHQEKMQIEVIWRSGKRSLINEVTGNQIYEIDESSSENFSQDSPSDPGIIYKDVSYSIDHIHYDEAFNDFFRQPLLPNQLSQLGPGISWYDLDHDLDEDLIITSGKGDYLSVYKNAGEAGFVKLHNPTENTLAKHDQTTVLVYENERGKVSMIIGSSNYESFSKAYPPAYKFQFKNQNILSDGELERELSATGPMSLSDYDNDGDLDLFIGGRVLPGKYPDPSSSRLYQNIDGKFELDKLNSDKLKQIGLVSGSVFSDIDNDGDSDLILALEWGPVTIFENESGYFTNVTARFGLNDIRGWWNGITTGDLDEDGKMDIVVSNWGLNTKYHYDHNHPLKIYYDDFDNNGTLDIVEAHYDPFRKSIVPERGFSCMSQAMPFIRSKISTFEQYGGSNIDEIMGSDLRWADSLKANILAHTIFFNRGDKFEMRELPAESQFAPAFYVGIADFDGDGHDDIFLSQNFFATQPETPRLDAGRGLWLKGNGEGDLKTIPGHISGIKVYGEQRGAALCDFDKDGRVDLAVSQNGARTKLFQNVLAKPGLRVRLMGPEKNPTAVGSVVQIVYKDNFGPARQIHAGSGYWSQDSPVLVFGLKEDPQKIKIKWPDGNITQSEIPGGAKEISVYMTGEVFKLY